MCDVLHDWEENVGDPKNVEEDPFLIRFRWSGGTRTTNDTADQLNLHLPSQPFNQDLPPSEPHVCFDPEDLEKAVGGSENDRLDLRNTLLHECVHGISKEYQTDHAYRKGNEQKFKTLKVPDRLLNPDHYKEMLIGWSKDSFKEPDQATLQAIFGDPAHWDGKTSVAQGGATLQQICSDVIQMLTNAQTQAQNRFKGTVGGAKPGVEDAAKWVTKEKTKSDEMQRLLALAKKVTPEADPERTAWVTFGDQVQITRRTGLPPTGPKQKTEGWVAMFPENHGKFQPEDVRGWFLKALLKNAVVRVGSGLTFEGIKALEAEYFKTRPGQPTTIR
jgi:hypothetical protein